MPKCDQFLYTFASWNIQGLRSKSHDKTRDPYFKQEIKNFDVVGLLETHTVEGQDPEIPIAGFETFYIHQPKHKNAPHGSGGIAILIKPHLRKGIKLFPSKTKDYVWLQLDKASLGLRKSLFICFAYIPPPESTYSKRLHQNILDLIESDIYNYKTRGDIILMGDLNARTAKNVDFIRNDALTHIPLSNDYSLDTDIPCRKSQDNVTDERGKHLLEICISAQLRILNGRKNRGHAGIPN